MKLTPIGKQMIACATAGAVFQVSQLADPWRWATAPAVTTFFNDAAQSSPAIADLLERIKWIESRGNIRAFNASTNACGLYQMIPSTAIGLMRKHGGELNRDDYDFVMQPSHGWSRPDAGTMFNRICGSETVSRQLVTKLTEDNAAFIRSHIGRDLNTTDLYLGHFLGNQGAVDFLQAYARNPNALAKDHVRRDAYENNKSTFHAHGQDLTLRQVYDNITVSLAAARVTNTAGAYSPSAKTAQVATARTISRRKP